MFKTQIEEIREALSGKEQMVECIEQQLKDTKEDVKKLKQALTTLEKLQGADD